LCRNGSNNNHTGWFTLLRNPDKPGKINCYGWFSLLRNDWFSLDWNKWFSLVRIIQEPIEALKTDLSLSSYQAGFLHLDLIQKNGIAQRGMNSPEAIHLPSCNCFYGNYKDLLGRLLSQDISYRLSITLWTQVKRI
jgi:hypothetical protein